MLEYLFTSKTRVKLIEFFFLNPDQSFHLRDISRRISASPVYVKKELNNLSKLGLIDFEKKGNLSLFSLKEDCIIFNDLKNIFLKTEGVSMLLRQKISSFDKIKFALIFGSFAKGLANKTSDVDLLIIGEISENDILKITSAFESHTKRELNFILWTEKEFKNKINKKVALLQDIIKDKFVIIKGNEKEFRESVKRGRD